MGDSQMDHRVPNIDYSGMGDWDTRTRTRRENKIRKLEQANKSSENNSILENLRMDLLNSKKQQKYQ